MDLYYYNFRGFEIYHYYSSICRHVIVILQKFNICHYLPIQCILLFFFGPNCPCLLSSSLVHLSARSNRTFRLLIPGPGGQGGRRCCPQVSRKMLRGLGSMASTTEATVGSVAGYTVSHHRQRAKKNSHGQIINQLIPLVNASLGASTMPYSS